MLDIPSALKGPSSVAALWKVPFGSLFVQGYDQLDQSRLEAGLVLILPGIEGKGVLNRSVAMGLLDARVPYAIQMFDWTEGQRVGPVNLIRFQRNQRQSLQIAQRIVEYKSQFPDRPVCLIGHSGGGGMLLLTLEALPDDCQIDHAVLLAPAISHHYDLSLACRKIKGLLHHFFSYNDLFFLALGTSVFGTIDRRFGVSAGVGGFSRRMVQSADPVVRQKLREYPFRLEMFRSWNLSGHFGCTNRLFVSRYLAPLIMGEVPEAMRRLNSDLGSNGRIASGYSSGGPA